MSSDGADYTSLEEAYWQWAVFLSGLASLPWLTHHFRHKLLNQNFVDVKWFVDLSTRLAGGKSFWFWLLNRVLPIFLVVGFGGEAFIWYRTEYVTFSDIFSYTGFYFFGAIGAFIAFATWRMKHHQAARAAVAAVAPGSMVRALDGSDESDESELSDDREVDEVGVPSYWTNQDERKSFDQMLYVKREVHPTFDELLQNTYKPIATQDRLCPSKTCPKTPGGCPCVKPGGTPGLPTAFFVRRVIRVEDSNMWRRYVKKRDEIKASRAGDLPLHPFNPPINTDEVADRHTTTFEPLESDYNEVYLWHGTKVRAALAIAQLDFKIDLAGTGAGTMYGRGAYMAESSTKADEYSQDEDGYYKGVFALLLCRVCLGKAYYTTTRNPEAGDKVKAGDYDSTCGDRAASANTYREFVVYNADQVYPEYVVLYSRGHAVDEDEVRQRAEAPFHMQLPVYWRNTHLNPYTESFAEQFKARRRTYDLIQRLVEGTSTRNSLKVVDVRRVESSEMWTRYVDFKATLHGTDDDGVHQPQQYASPNELDGNAEEGHTLTSKILQENDAECVISLENFDSSINELLLWHGSTQEAVASIAQAGFRIARGSGDTAHGARFGQGAYFAENLDKSLSYARSVSGVYHILLCRVTCGDFYYTEERSQVNAHNLAVEGSKHSILANPEGSGPREFICLAEQQVYPEFVVQLSGG